MKVYSITPGKDKLVGIVRTKVELQILLVGVRLSKENVIGYSIHGEFNGQVYSGEISVQDLTSLAS